MYNIKKKVIYSLASFTLIFWLNITSFFQPFLLTKTHQLTPIQQEKLKSLGLKVLVPSYITLSFKVIESFIALDFNSKKEKTKEVSKKVEYKNIRFNNLLSNKKLEIRQLPDTPAGDENPAHIQFKFIDPQSTDDYNYFGDILVYPTANFRGYQEEIKIRDALKRILDKQGDFSKEEMLPYLPFTAAPQVFHIRNKYLSFQSGKGIRYLTYFAFDVRPIDSLTYTYQGLSSNGKYYVAATFTLTTKLVPGNTSNINFMTGENYENYLHDLFRQINQADEIKDFLPSLKQLDDMMKSIQIKD